MFSSSSLSSSSFSVGGGAFFIGMVARVRRGGAGNLYHWKFGYASKNASLYYESIHNLVNHVD